MKTSLFRNLRLQTYLHVVNTLIPLITTPYVARVLGASMIGIFSSFHSIASFFTLFAVMGTNIYGTRCISLERDNEKRKTLFLEIYYMQLVTCVLASLCYLFYCVFLASNKVMAFLQFITLFGCFIEVSWFYFGIEDFKVTVLTSVVFRVISVICLLTLVKDREDLWIYTIIMLGSALMSQLVLWLGMWKNGYFKRRIVERGNVLSHFLPNIKLFIPLLAMTVCTSTDKAMLGTLSTYEQAGYYSNIDRIINVPFSIFTGFGTVFLPRISSIYSENKDRAKQFFFDTLSGIIMLGVAICCGIIAVADNFIPFFLGSGYASCIFLIKVFSPVIIIKCISNAIRMHFLIPFKMEAIYIKATGIGAILNVILNFILVPRYGALGAIFTTLVSEIIVLAIQVAIPYKASELKKTVVDLLAYLCIGTLMILALKFIGFECSKGVVKILFDVVIGAFIYCILTLIYWIISHNRFYEMNIKPRVVNFFRRMNRK